MTRLKPHPTADRRPEAAAAQADDGPAGATPIWDTATRRLWWRGECVKCFRHEAPNQRRLLDTFEAAGWPELLADARPPDEPGIDARSWLRETIKSLNRGQRALSFRGDGTGLGVRWGPA